MPFTVSNQLQHSVGDLRAASATLVFGKLASESLGDPDLSSTTKWAGATDWSDTIAGSTSYLHSGGTGTLTQTAANQAISGVASRKYRFTYTISSINIAGAITLEISTAYGGSAVELAIAATGTFSIDFTTDEGAATADFVLSATSTTTLDAFTLTNFSLKQIPEYPGGGESLTPQMLGLGQFVGDVQINSDETGYNFKWDRTNEKIIVRSNANIPQLVVDETVTFAANVGTLKYAPAYIVSVVAGTAQVYQIIPDAESAANNVSVQVNWTTGVITEHATESNTTLLVTYFPQRPGTFFSKENLVIDEVVRADTDPVNLDNKAAAIQYVYGTTDTLLTAYDTPGDAPDSGSVTIDMDDDNGGTTLLFNAAEANAGNEVFACTYLKAVGLGGDVAFIDDIELDFRNNTAQGFSWILDVNATAGAPFGDNALGVPGYGVNFIGEDGSNVQERAQWSSYLDTAADGTIIWNPRANTALGAQTGTLDNSQLSWLKVQSDTGSGLSEIATPQDLSGITLTVYATGR